MRLAHISDLHLLNLSGTRPTDFLNKRMTGGLNLVLGRAKQYSTDVFTHLMADLNDQGVDHVLCTGDVTNLALESEFSFAHSQLVRFGGAERLSLIPGNHDAYTRSAADDHRFARTFAAWFPQPDAAARGEGFPYVKTFGRTRIIGLSSAVKSPFGCSYGELGGKQLERLDQLLADPALADYFVIVLVHHHLHDSGKPYESIRGLRDRLLFLNRLRCSDVDLVLHGHEHEPHRWKLLAGRRAIRIESCGTSTRLHRNPEKLGRYTIYEVDGNRLAGSQRKIFSPSLRRFVDEP